MEKTVCLASNHR